MSSAFAIAQGGLAAAETRLAVSASNVANALTPGYTPREVEQADLAGGGVTATVAPPPDAGAPGAIAADRALAGLSLSGVDLAHEVVSQALAARAFSASLASLEAADEQAGALVDLIR